MVQQEYCTSPTTCDCSYHYIDYFRMPDKEVVGINLRDIVAKAKNVSNSEATRLIRSGAVDLMEPRAHWGWRKVIDPTYKVNKEASLRIGKRIDVEYHAIDTDYEKEYNSIPDIK